MKTGVIKWYNSTKGYGFVKESNSETEYFVHASGLNEEVNENDRVEFEVVEGNKGLKAVNVKVI